MRVLLCPASLKGVLSAREAAAALARGARAADAEAVELPVADGGEGTADALHAALGGEWLEAVVSDPLGRPVSARWLVLPDGRAVVEAASAIGLPLLAESERDPLVASSRGLGELVARGAPGGRQGLVVGLGGSATVDGGAGMREVVRELPFPRPSSATYAPSSPTRRVSSAPRRERPRRTSSSSSAGSPRSTELAPYAALPGSGAAGGLGAAFAALGAELVPGAPAVLELVGFDERTRRLRPRDHRARGRWTGRRWRGRHRVSSPRAARRPASAVSSSAGV